MGTWGTGVFSDETACDVRDEWREYVGGGLSGPQATDRLLTEWADALNDSDDGPLIWLALAAAQSAAGRLENRVKQKALAVIDDESSLTRWREDRSLLKKRIAALAKLREQLLAAQPAAKKVRKITKAQCAWDEGDVIAYRLHSGKSVLFQVVAKVTDRGGTYPYCQFFDWTGEVIPTEARIRKLSNKPGIVMMCGATMRGYPAERLTPTSVRIPVETQTSAFGVGVWMWSKLDQQLNEKWGWG